MELVPIDVRVVDREGNLVTDLKQTDFAILEDGVPQEIAHFLRVSASSPSAIAPDNPLANALADHRTFLIVLGRGQLNTPVRAIDALIDFIRDRLLPADRIGVLTYLRASEFTADRSQIVRLLETHRDRHAAIEGRLENYVLRRAGAVWLTPETRAAIDGLFQQPGLPALRELPGAAGSLAFPYNDTVYLRSGIELLRGVAGEKQLILVSEKALALGRFYESPDDHYFVRLATGARVAVSFLHTGGVPGQAMSLGRLGSSRAESFNVFLAADHRLLASRTGGSMAAFYQDPDKPLARLDQLTRFQYLLGYYPGSQAAGDRHRRIEVSVTKPGLTVLHRHGYQMRPMRSDAEDLRAVISEDRIASVVSYLRDATQRPIASIPRPRRLSGALVTRGGDTQVELQVIFDPSRLTFERRNGKYLAGADLAAVVDDGTGRPLMHKIERVSLDMSAAEFSRAQREWVEASLTVPVTGEPAHVRVVVYEYESDQILAAGTITLRRQSPPTSRPLSPRTSR